MLKPAVSHTSHAISCRHIALGGNSKHLISCSTRGHSELQAFVPFHQDLKFFNCNRKAANQMQAYAYIRGLQLF